MNHAGTIIAAVGPVSVTITGASAAAISATAVIVGVGAGIAMVAAGVGIYHHLRGRPSDQGHERTPKRHILSRS